MSAPRATSRAQQLNERVKALLTERDQVLDARWQELLETRPRSAFIRRGHRYLQKRPGKDWLLRLDDTVYSEEDKALLRQYSGSGGLGRYGASGVGLLQEFYTPLAICRACLALARHYGWQGDGPVLEPSAGVGHFLALLGPIEIDAFELNPTSARILQVLYPTAQVRQGEFECYFISDARRSVGPDLDRYPRYTLAVGNPPFGTYFGRCSAMGERAYAQAPTLETYFVFRSLDLLEPGGLLVFVLPASFLQNSGKLTRIKQRLQAKAVLLDAWRLWNGALYHTEELTDLVVLRRTEGLTPEQLQRLMEHHTPAGPEAWLADGWFQAHPERILGTYQGRKGTWRRPVYRGDESRLEHLYRTLQLSPKHPDPTPTLDQLRQRLAARYATP